MHKSGNRAGRLYSNCVVGSGLWRNLRRNWPFCEQTVHFTAETGDRHRIHESSARSAYGAAGEGTEILARLGKVLRLYCVLGKGLRF